MSNVSLIVSLYHLHRKTRRKLPLAMFDIVIHEMNQTSMQNMTNSSRLARIATEDQINNFNKFDNNEYTIFIQ